MGRRIAQHVEANPSTVALVSGRQSAPIASLLAIFGLANQGADGRDFDSSLRLERGSPSQLNDALDRDCRIFVLPGRNLRIAVRYSGVRDRAPEGEVCR